MQVLEGLQLDIMYGSAQDLGPWHSRVEFSHIIQEIQLECTNNQKSNFYHTVQQYCLVGMTVGGGCDPWKNQPKISVVLVT